MNIVHPKGLVRLPAMRKLFAVVALLAAGGALAGEAVLVHDIEPPHPRYTQLTQMAAEVARCTQDTLTIAINPGGKVRPRGCAPRPHIFNVTPPGIVLYSYTDTTNHRMVIRQLPAISRRIARQ